MLLLLAHNVMISALARRIGAQTWRISETAGVP